MNTTKTPVFGSRWRALVAKTSDDWRDECRANGTAFAATLRAERCPPVAGTIAPPIARGQS